MQIWIFNQTVDCVKGIHVPETVTLQYLRERMCMDEFCVREFFTTMYKVHGLHTEGSGKPILEGDYLSPEGIRVIDWLAVRRCSLIQRVLHSTSTPCRYMRS